MTEKEPNMHDQLCCIGMHVYNVSTISLMEPATADFPSQHPNQKGN